MSKDWQSQAHVKWDCKYHVVILPKYRKKVLFGRLRKQIGTILRDLCRQKEVELVEGKAMPDHVHMLLKIPPKFSVAMTMGFLKAKSAIRIHRELLNTKKLSENGRNPLVFQAFRCPNGRFPGSVANWAGIGFGGLTV